MGRAVATMRVAARRHRIRTWKGAAQGSRLRMKSKQNTAKYSSSRSRRRDSAVILHCARRMNHPPRVQAARGDRCNMCIKWLCASLLQWQLINRSTIRASHGSNHTLLRRSAHLQRDWRAGSCACGSKSNRKHDVQARHRGAQDNCRS